jgi:hypothetical protein
MKRILTEFRFDLIAGVTTLSILAVSAHVRQMRHMRRELKRLKTYLGRIYRDVARKVLG